MQDQLIKVICDTSFLIPLVTKRIKNIDNLEIEIGSIQFVVPISVIKELEKLQNDPQKNPNTISHVITFAKKLPSIDIGRNMVDEDILEYVKANGGGIVATMDKELKDKIKNNGGSIISLNNDRIVLE